MTTSISRAEKLGQFIGHNVKDSEKKPNIYMASVVKKKTSPIDRKEERDSIRPKVNEALTNDPMVRTCVFRREET